MQKLATALRPRGPLGSLCSVAATLRKFAHELAVYQAAAFAIWVQPFRVGSAEAIFHDERITRVRSPLFMKWHDPFPTAFGNNIPHPLWIRVTGAAPLSPPDISQSGKTPCFGSRSGPIAGSYEMNFIAAGTALNCFHR
jgi:hypothetical protein